MDLTLSHCFVPVPDLDAGLAFYRDVIGLDVRADVTMGDFRWVTVGSAAQPEVEIGLMPVPMPYHSAGDIEMFTSLLAKGALPAIIFATDDVDATFERVRSAGAEVLQEPIDQAYGVRDCAFRDPFGTMVRFSGRERR
jgi:catechol 2,3-dioxygenase-like lactoylglutathione lyase family enzyme